MTGKDKAEIAEVLKRIPLDEGAVIPILNRLTEKIEIHCNGGSISDIKPTLRLK